MGIAVVKGRGESEWPFRASTNYIHTNIHTQTCTHAYAYVIHSVYIAYMTNTALQTIAI